MLPTLPDVAPTTAVPPERAPKAKALVPRQTPSTLNASTAHSSGNRCRLRARFRKSPLKSAETLSRRRV